MCCCTVMAAALLSNSCCCDCALSSSVQCPDAPWCLRQHPDRKLYLILLHAFESRHISCVCVSSATVQEGLHLQGAGGGGRHLQALQGACMRQVPIYPLETSSSRLAVERAWQGRAVLAFRCSCACLLIRLRMQVQPACLLWVTGVMRGWWGSAGLGSEMWVMGQGPLMGPCWALPV